MVAMVMVGCGATSVRVSVGPTVDTRGQVGVEAGAAVAIGWPVDLRGRSRHFVQLRGGVSAERRGDGGGAVLRLDADTLHWALPGLDVRAGAGYARRLGDERMPALSSSASPSSSGASAWLALLGVVHQNAGGHPMVHHVAVGPELRAEVLWLDAGRGTRGLFSLPLTAELSLLAAGD